MNLNNLIIFASYLESLKINNMKIKHKVTTILFILFYSMGYSQSPVNISDISNWPLLRNSPTAWEEGAFNISVDQSNINDLSWGVYNPSNHNVYGDSLYIIQLADNTYKQLYVDQLVNSDFTFHMADIDGNNTQTVTINKTGFSGKNFGYYSIYFDGIDHNIEPLASDWDLVFYEIQ